MKRRYVDHHICEECHGAHKEAFYYLTDWPCPNRRYKVNRYSGTAGPCKKLIGRNIYGEVSREVCKACSHYDDTELEEGRWECNVCLPDAYSVAAWSKLPKECTKKREHCVANTLGEDDFLKKDETNPPGSV